MKEMTSLERVQAVLNGQLPDRLPVVPQSFMFSALTGGYHIGQINRNPAKMAECHRISQEKYGYDGCVIDVDDATLAEAWRAKVHYVTTTSPPWMKMRRCSRTSAISTACICRIPTRTAVCRSGWKPRSASWRRSATMPSSWAGRSGPL